MKRTLLLTLLLLTASVHFGWAQCSPDPNANGAFFYPAPTAPLPSGTVGTPYAQVITINVPADTAIDLGALIGFPFPPVTVTVNQLSIGTLTGLPAGITGTPNPGTGIILGGSNGCIDIVGTPTTSGQYAFNIPGTLNVTVPQQVPVIGGSQQNIPAPVPYNMEVVGTTAVTPGQNGGLTVSQSQPNPTRGMTVIRYSVAVPSDLSLQLIDVTGKLVLQQTQTGATGAGSFRFDADELAPGIYLYRISDGQHSVVRKMVVE